MSEFRCPESSRVFAADTLLACHVGPDFAALAQRPGLEGYRSLDKVIDAAAPSSIRTRTPMMLSARRNERQGLSDLAALAVRNVVTVPIIGRVYSAAITPQRVQRNKIQPPARFAAHTPYQPEISQGRLEVWLTSQAMIQDLTVLPVASAILAGLRVVVVATVDDDSTDRRVSGELCGRSAARTLPGALRRACPLGRTRVHPRLTRADATIRSHSRRHRERLIGYVHDDRIRVCGYPPSEAFATPTPAQPANGRPLLQKSQT